MTDTHDKLYGIAEPQAGYFSASQAVSVGMAWSTLSQSVRPGGRFIRVARGVYRFRQFPPSPHDTVVAQWLAFFDSKGVVSHETALILYDLTDLIGDTVHITFPRSERWRWRTSRPGVCLHSVKNPLRQDEQCERFGIPVTSVERSIVDYALKGGQPEQVAMAIEGALKRGFTTSKRLLHATSERPKRVKQLIKQSLEDKK